RCPPASWAAGEVRAADGAARAPDQAAGGSAHRIRGQEPLSLLLGFGVVPLGRLRARLPEHRVPLAGRVADRSLGAVGEDGLLGGIAGSDVRLRAAELRQEPRYRQ